MAILSLKGLKNVDRAVSDLLVNACLNNIAAGLCGFGVSQLHAVGIPLLWMDDTIMIVVIC